MNTKNYAENYFQNMWPDKVKKCVTDQILEF